ncbi:class III extradiol ring-cleavage dioxygenase [Polyangium sp. 6x1]|uniref:DODA-type extradiol aromatic ring-opening family dioxygenase n=1 Tax=Polyangium sp. 6x1 TaxID=3042689 RepID=UPI002482A311|nr:class III extradiol ring-cleavage dioxygenase [Polyangium sp. 6x1]MDI1444168.1 class III extradiol ring-cleavage dioxygenase [Polyangium sp. 6x1]
MNHEREEGLTRRQAIVAGIAGAATIAALPGALGGAAEPSADEPRAPSVPGRLPVVFLPHGGGPWPFVDVGMGKAEHDELAGYLRSIRALPKAPPKALLVVSAHWEEPVPTVMTAERPPMFYDYYGFPPASYTLQWPAPGAPALASRVRELLGAAGFETAENAKRGFDHGTFVPLMLTYPDADVPTIQLSLKLGLDPATHLAMGRALAPLRDEGVFLLGSGMTYHNMRGFRDPGAGAVSEAFDAWLRETMAMDAKERDARLAAWPSAPSARLAHPREEHLLPLMVVAGAAGADRGTTAYNGSVWGKRLSAYHFG